MRGHRPPLKRLELEVAEDILLSLHAGVQKTTLPVDVLLPKLDDTWPMDYDRVIFKAGDQFKEYEFEGTGRRDDGQIDIFLGDKKRFST